MPGGSLSHRDRPGQDGQGAGPRRCGPAGETPVEGPPVGVDGPVRPRSRDEPRKWSSWRCRAGGKGTPDADPLAGGSFTL